MIRAQLRSGLILAALTAASCSQTPSTPGPGAAGGTGQGGSGPAAAGSGPAVAGSASGLGGGGTASDAGGAGSGGTPSGAAGASTGGTLGGSSNTAGGGGTTAVAGTGNAAGSGGAGGFVGTGCQGASVCYGFEECATPSGWTVPQFPDGEGNKGPGSTLVDNVKPHTGTCSLHMKDFSGDQPQHALLADLPPNMGPILWGRVWVFNTAAPSQHGALIKARYSIPNSADLDWYEVGYELKNYNGQWHNPLPPSGLPEWILRSSTPVGINVWQCVEWLFDAQNDGHAEAADPRIWVDGTEITFGPGIEYDLSNETGKPRPTTPKAADFMSIEVGLTMYHQLDMPMNVYLDDLAFGKQRIGCNP